MAEIEPVRRPKKVAQKKAVGQKKDDGEQVADMPHVGPELISSQTRSKVNEAKAVQTEPATVSIGTNTLNVSFSEEQDAVLEFPEY